MFSSSPIFPCADGAVPSKHRIIKVSEHLTGMARKEPAALAIDRRSPYRSSATPTSSPGRRRPRRRLERDQVVPDIVNPKTIVRHALGLRTHLRPPTWADCGWKFGACPFIQARKDSTDGHRRCRSRWRLPRGDDEGSSSSTFDSSICRRMGFRRTVDLGGQHTLRAKENNRRVGEFAYPGTFGGTWAVWS